MSALTDLFTAMANKIRSKTGTQTTYTPAEMVSDGIDDVFDAGVASVPTPTSITPSNSSPVALTANTPVNPTTSGYAIESYTSFEPSNLFPIALTASSPVIPTGQGVAIGSYLSITPSTDGTAFPSGFVKMSSVGWAIRSFQSVTPTTSGASFDSGFVKMSSSGYAYSAQPTLKATTLWTNSSPTSTFAEQTITLSQDIDNFSYIGIKYRATTSSSDTMELIITPADLKKSTTTSTVPRIVIGASNSSGNRYDRGVSYQSDTSIAFGGSYRVNTSGSSNTTVIPLYVYGYKIQA